MELKVITFEEFKVKPNWLQPLLIDGIDDSCLLRGEVILPASHLSFTEVRIQVIPVNIIHPFVNCCAVFLHVFKVARHHLLADVLTNNLAIVATVDGRSHLSLCPHIYLRMSTL